MTCGMRRQPGAWVVYCADDYIRHDSPFANRAAAAHWLTWGHYHKCPTPSQHHIVQVSRTGRTPEPTAHHSLVAENDQHGGQAAAASNVASGAGQSFRNPPTGRAENDARPDPEYVASPGPAFASVYAGNNRGAKFRVTAGSGGEALDGGYPDTSHEVTV